MDHNDPYFDIRKKITRQLQHGAILLTTKVKQYNGADEFGGLYAVSLGAHTPAVKDDRYPYQMIMTRKTNQQRERKMKERGIDIPPQQSEELFTIAVLAAKAFVNFVGVDGAREAARDAQRLLDQRKEQRERDRQALITRVNAAVETDALKVRLKEQS